MSASGAAGGLDVLIVSLGSTAGLRDADQELAASLRRAGARVELAVAARPAALRTMALTDLSWARAARGAALASLRKNEASCIVYSTTTAALLWPRPGAIRFDATAAGNRPGRHGLWQRPLERRRLDAAPLLLPLSAGALEELPREARARALAPGRALVLPLAVEPSGPPPERREIAAVTYAGNPLKKGLDRVLAAWRAVRASGVEPGELVVAGASPEELHGAGIDLSGEPGVRDAGRLPREDYRALVRGSRVFVCAPRREDYGQAQLEALADGCLLATTPAPGPYAALAIARRLDPRLVDADLAAALSAALVHPDPAGYAARALDELAPLRPEAIDARVARELVPALAVAI